MVRNVYTFSFDPERIGRLVKELEAVFEQTKQELSAFADCICITEKLHFPPRAQQAPDDFCI